MNNINCKILSILAAALIIASVAAPAAASTGANIDLVTLPSRQTVQLTIYNSEDLTLVKETRTITLKKGQNQTPVFLGGHAHRSHQRGAAAAGKGGPDRSLRYHLPRRKAPAPHLEHRFADRGTGSGGGELLHLRPLLGDGLRGRHRPRREQTQTARLCKNLQRLGRAVRKCGDPADRRHNQPGGKNRRPCAAGNCSD